MKHENESTGCIWPLGGGIVGVIVGLVVGCLAEYYDGFRYLDLPGMLIGPAMMAGGILGIALGYLGLLLSRQHRNDERMSR